MCIRDRPNAWDFASAAALVDAGFRAIGTTSLGVAAASGRLDGHGVTLAPTITLARQVSRLDCWFTVDIEAGFTTESAADDDMSTVDESKAVADLVAELADIGAAGVNLEDGRPSGRLAPVDLQCTLIAAAKRAAPDLYLNARTDTHWLGGRSLDEAITRCRSYVEAGADGVFVPGLTGRGDIRTVARAVGVPLNVLYHPGGLSVRELAGLGVARVSCGSLLFRAAVGTTVSTALAIARGEAVTADLPSYADIQRMTG